MMADALRPERGTAGSIIRGNSENVVQHLEWNTKQQVGESGQFVLELPNGWSAYIGSQVILGQSNEFRMTYVAKDEDTEILKACSTADDATNFNCIFDEDVCNCITQGTVLKCDCLVLDIEEIMIRNAISNTAVESSITLQHADNKVKTNFIWSLINAADSANSTETTPKAEALAVYDVYYFVKNTIPTTLYWIVISIMCYVLLCIIKDTMSIVCGVSNIYVTILKFVVNVVLIIFVSSQNFSSVVLFYNLF